MKKILSGLYEEHFGPFALRYEKDGRRWKAWVGIDRVCHLTGKALTFPTLKEARRIAKNRAAIRLRYLMPGANRNS